MPFIQNEEHVRTKRGHVGRMEIMESMAGGVDFAGWGCCGMSGQHPTSISSPPKIPSQVEFILSHNRISSTLRVEICLTHLCIPHSVPGIFTDLVLECILDLMITYRFFAFSGLSFLMHLIIMPQRQHRWRHTWYEAWPLPAG